MNTHARLWLAGVSTGLTIAYVAIAIADPVSATPIGFVYVGLLFVLHCVFTGLRRLP